MNLLTKWYCNGNTLPHNWNFWGCCEAEAAISLFSVICSWFSKVLLFVFVTKINSQLLMQHDWFMYHLRSTYKNRLDFPFNHSKNGLSYRILSVISHFLVSTNTSGWFIDYSKETSMKFKIIHNPINKTKDFDYQECHTILGVKCLLLLFFIFNNFYYIHEW